ncbi:F-box/kelch-repeat protein [Cardamine amara subsp. amara]|uniref:F-box/kelch-repeat protein n=1 Tax=Cardamine amara subsp. amara TaxID=228776 RepID=A0ABD1B5A3_CARAN
MMNSEVEPPWKRRKKTNLPPPSPTSFLSLPNELILHCLARVPKSYYPKLSLVSKIFRSLVFSIELNHARFHHKTQECYFSVCLQFPDNPFPSWFTLWIQPDDHQLDKDKKKKKSTLVKVPSSYASRVPLFLVSVGSDIYSFRQYHPPSTIVLVRNKDSCLWRRAPNMSVARTNPVACALDGKIYVMGGCDADETARWGEVFDTKTQTWEPLPDPGPELRFSKVIRKIQVIQRKFYVRSNEKKDSVYDLKLGKWNVAAKPPVSESYCVVDKVVYSCRKQSCLWYDKESNEWILVKGLSSLNQTCRRCLIELFNYNGKLLLLWDKYVKPRSNSGDKNICCALIALEKRKNGHVWGKVEWSNVVLTVPDSYAFLRSTILRT